MRPSASCRDSERTPYFLTARFRSCWSSSRPLTESYSAVARPPLGTFCATTGLGWLFSAKWTCALRLLEAHKHLPKQTCSSASFWQLRPRSDGPLLDASDLHSLFACQRVFPQPWLTSTTPRSARRGSKWCLIASPLAPPKAAARRRRSETRTRTLLDRPFALAPSRCAGNVGTRPGDSLQLFIHFHCSCEFATNLRNQPARCEKRSRCALKIQYSHRQRTHAIHSRECEKTFE